MRCEPRVLDTIDSVDASEPEPIAMLVQGQLNRFAECYNGERPHRSLGRRTPLEAWNAREKVGPIGKRIEAAGYRVRHDKVDVGGSVTLRHKGKLNHIGIGCPYAGWRVILLVDGLDIRILGLDGSPLQHMTLDPSVDYQRIPEPTTGQLYDVSRPNSYNRCRPNGVNGNLQPQRDSNPCRHLERVVS